MIILKVLVIVSLHVLACFAEDCTISMRDDLSRDGQPSLLKPGIPVDNDEAFYLPNKDGRVEIKTNEEVEVACPGEHVVIGDTDTDKNKVTAKCTSGKFIIDGTITAISSIKCVAVRVVRKSEKTCGEENKYKVLEILIRLGGGFYKVMDICFDEEKGNTLYSQFKLTKTIGNAVGGSRPTQFIQDDFYNKINLDTLYNRDTQRKTINNLLGMSKDTPDDKYIKDNSDFYLSKGHLTANADFVYTSQRRITFSYINVAPQWQTFNSGNWAKLEADIRAYVSRHEEDVIVYTGTYGVATLPHEKARSYVPLYLHVNKEQRRIPVPALFWKLVYNKATKAGTVFLGVNNPYRQVDPNENICMDICSKSTEFGWLKWDKNNQIKGYSYCCNVKDFIDKSKIALPGVDVEKLWGQTCPISINRSLDELQSMVLNKNFTDVHDTSYLPISEGNGYLEEDKAIQVSCKTGKLVVDDVPTSKTTDTATCKSGKFTINDQTVEFSSIKCDDGSEIETAQLP